MAASLAMRAAAASAFALWGSLLARRDTGSRGADLLSLVGTIGERVAGRVEELRRLRDIAEFVDGGQCEDIEQVLPVPMRLSALIFLRHADGGDQIVQIGDGRPRMIVVQPPESAIENLLVADTIVDAPQVPDKAKSQVRIFLPGIVEVTTDIHSVEVLSYAIEGVQNRVKSRGESTRAIRSSRPMGARLQSFHERVLRSRLGNSKVRRLVIGRSWNKNIQKIFVEQFGDDWESHTTRRVQSRSSSDGGSDGSGVRDVGHCEWTVSGETCDFGVDTYNARD